MNKTVKKILSFGLCVGLCLGGQKAQASTILSSDVIVASSGNELLGLEGSFVAKDVDAAIERINAIRKEACDEGVPYTFYRHGYYETRALTPDDYSPLVWSGSMETIARIRAAEAIVYEDHVRPDGSSIFDLEVVSGQDTVRTYGENLAWNYSTSMVDAINQWYAEKDDYVNGVTNAVVGHYTSMINPDYACFAMGLFDQKQDGWNAIAGEFNYTSGLYETKQPAATNIVQTIQVKKSSLSSPVLEGTGSLQVGKQTSFKLMVPTTNLGVTKNLLVLDSVSFSSSNNSVATVTSSGVVTGIKKGSAQITAKSASGYKATATVTVTQTASTSTAKASSSNVSKYMPTTKFKSIKAQKTSLKLRWAKKKNITGYQIQIAKKNKFTKGLKTVKVKKKSKTSVKVKKLKKKTRYYLRIRTYLKAGTTMIYSSWSKTKSKKTKKK
ncbi:MAG: CAP domain-containing protein [Eubacterium sp.]|nr:CAP domain-containing protein [Eubacterium sp.]